ncbi:hypothetical protein [Pseudonocardia sp.]|uniref:hypothetical protein n=1 Tax=Pseudonocardia sp. TaxID=60912 RepID=UPI003D146867|nr:hypothetical protein [Actinomycetota bacterium]
MTMISGHACRPVLAALLGAIVLVGCTEGPQDPLPTSTSPGIRPSASSATPTVSTTTLTESVEALAAYDRFWAAKVASQADPTKEPPKALRANAIDKALSDALATVLLLRRNGVEMRGEPTHETSVVSVAAGARPEVAITDCLDSTGWLPVFVATGDSALAPGQSPRVVVESVATIFDGRWVIKTSTAFRDRSC